MASAREPTPLFADSHAIMPPVICESASEILRRYDALICDVWGVVHDGEQAYAAAGEALARFRNQGGTVLLLSNSPMPSDAVIGVLDQKGVRRDAYDATVTSGDITRSHLKAAGISRVHHVGPARDLVLFEGTNLDLTGLDSAEAIVCTGLVDDINHTGETYRPLLEQALAIRLPFVCANPDLVVDVGNMRLLCAGTLAALYESIGGDVTWAGKPYASAYQLAFETIARLRGVSVPQSRILALGDALRTDIAGAAAAGLDAVFIAQGIHRDEIVDSDRIVPERLMRLFDETPAAVTRAIIATMPQLAA
jgi:HAD superfamily hydrolase (TIGR01459 family)